jgi:hypothetical protein
MNKIIIHLKEWEINGFKNKSKSLMIFPFKLQQMNGLEPSMPVGQVLHNKYPYLDLELIEPGMMHIDQITDEMALQFGIAELYPKSEFGGDGFYLPDQILEASALDCFKHYWDSQPEHTNFKFETNPAVVIFELKKIKGHS